MHLTPFRVSAIKQTPRLVFVFLQRDEVKLVSAVLSMTARVAPGASFAQLSGAWAAVTLAATAMKHFPVKDLEKPVGHAVTDGDLLTDGDGSLAGTGGGDLRALD